MPLVHSWNIGGKASGGSRFLKTRELTITQDVIVKGKEEVSSLTFSLKCSVDHLFLLAPPTILKGTIGVQKKLTRAKTIGRGGGKIDDIMQNFLYGKQSEVFSRKIRQWNTN